MVYIGVTILISLRVERESENPQTRVFGNLWFVRILWSPLGILTLIRDRTELKSTDASKRY